MKAPQSDGRSTMRFEAPQLAGTKNLMRWIAVVQPQTPGNHRAAPRSDRVASGPLESHSRNRTGRGASLPRA